MDLKRIFKVVM